MKNIEKMLAGFRWGGEMVVRNEDGRLWATVYEYKKKDRRGRFEWIAAGVRSGNINELLNLLDDTVRKVLDGEVS